MLNRQLCVDGVLNNDAWTQIVVSKINQIVSSKINQIIQNPEKIEIIELKLILIKRIINLIKEIEIKENPTKENLIREINQILEMVNTIISLLGKDDGDSIDKTVQTILDMKLGKTNKRIRKHISLIKILNLFYNFKF